MWQSKSAGSSWDGMTHLEFLLSLTQPPACGRRPRCSTEALCRLCRRAPTSDPAAATTISVCVENAKTESTELQKTPSSCHSKRLCMSRDRTTDRRAHAKAAWERQCPAEMGANRFELSWRRAKPQLLFQRPYGLCFCRRLDRRCSRREQRFRQAPWRWAQLQVFRNLTKRQLPTSTRG